MEIWGIEGKILENDPSRGSCGQISRHQAADDSLAGPRELGASCLIETRCIMIIAACAGEIFRRVQDAAFAARYNEGAPGTHACTSNFKYVET
jgi:hypothetical protein